jgi:hypothetical protein
VGHPSLVKPNAEKIDFSAIRSAVPKYQSLDEMDKSWWFDFLEQFEATFLSFNAAEPTSVLREIETIIESCYSTLIQPTVATNVSNQLLKRHHDSIDTIPEVISLQKACIRLFSVYYAKIVSNNKMQHIFITYFVFMHNT